MEAIISAMITGVLALTGTIITVLVTNTKTQRKFDTSIAVMETKVDELTREVRQHNNFAMRMPVVEQKIKSAEHRIDNLEHNNRPFNASTN